MYPYEQQPMQSQQQHQQSHPQQQQPEHRPQQPQHQPVNPQAFSKPKVEDEEDEDFDIQLDAPQPAAQMRPEVDEVIAHTCSRVFCDIFERFRS